VPLCAAPDRRGSVLLGCPITLRLLLIVELVASFRSRRSVSHGLRGRATALDERRCGQQNGGTPWSRRGGMRVESRVFWPVRS